MSEDVVSQIPGSAELIAWFGRFPSLHDANVIDFRIDGAGSGHLTAKAFQMTDKVDEKGYFVIEKHCTVTFHFDEIVAVELTDFLPGQAILFQIKIGKVDNEFLVTFDSSYGFGGTLRMRKLRVSFVPDTNELDLQS